MAHLNASDPKGAYGDTDLELRDDGGAVLFQEYGANRSRVFLSAWQVANLAGAFRRHREAAERSATPAAGEALTEALESIARHADEMAAKSEEDRRRAADGTKTGAGHSALYLGMKVAAESIAEEVRRRAAALAAARKEG